MTKNIQTKRTKIISSHKFLFRSYYKGSFFWLILSLLWFPVTFVLLFKNASCRKGNSRFFFDYHGSYGWLIFWAFLFFPVCILLVIFNGFDYIEEEEIIAESCI
jgi:hypothetical protein